MFCTTLLAALLVNTLLDLLFALTVLFCKNDDDRVATATIKGGSPKNIDNGSAFTSRRWGPDPISIYVLGVRSLLSRIDSLARLTPFVS